MHSGDPLVTVVIPTRNRPHLVIRAVASVLTQTFADLEVMVIVDGPDRTTTLALASIQAGDPRLKVIELPESGGANGARNRGVTGARGRWIAFLDDDDVWLPSKLEKQLRCAENFPEQTVAISCQFVARSSIGDSIWPRRFPVPGEAIADYLYWRRSWFYGGASFVTSTLLLPKKLFDNVQFSTKLRRNQEVDLVLRARSIISNLVFVPEPLVIWAADENRSAITNTYDWRHSLEWARGIRPLVSTRAYSGLVLVCLSAEASRQGDWKAFFLILSEAFSAGAPTLRHLVLFFAMWFIPTRLRQYIRRIFHGAQEGARTCE